VRFSNGLAVTAHRWLSMGSVCVGQSRVYLLAGYAPERGLVLNQVSLEDKANAMSAASLVLVVLTCGAKSSAVTPCSPNVSRRPRSSLPRLLGHCFRPAPIQCLPDSCPTLHSFSSGLTLHRRLALKKAFPQTRKSKDLLRTRPVCLMQKSLESLTLPEEAFAPMRLPPLR